MDRTSDGSDRFIDVFESLALNAIKNISNWNELTLFVFDDHVSNAVIQASQVRREPLAPKGLDDGIHSFLHGTTSHTVTMQRPCCSDNVARLMRRCSGQQRASGSQK
jgi:hypothetical protein